MKHSVHILAGNCQDTIERCLNSVKWADEISIVYDTRSTDDTLVTIQEWTKRNFRLNSIHKALKIHDFNWPNDSFSDARNFGLSKCTGDWVWYLDADEEIIDPITPDNKYDAYFCTITKEGWRDRNVRIMKNGVMKYRWARHNSPAKGIVRALKIGESDTIFQGFTQQSEEVHLAKAGRLLKRHLKQLDEEPDNYTLDYYITRCYYGFNDWEKVKEYGHRAINNDYEEDIPDTWKAQICIYLHIAYLHTGTPRNALHWLNMSIAYLSAQLWAWCLMYEFMFKKGDYKEAAHIKMIIQTTEVSYLPVEMNEEQIINLFKVYNLEKSKQLTT